MLEKLFMKKGSSKIIGYMFVGGVKFRVVAGKCASCGKFEKNRIVDSRPYNRPPYCCSVECREKALKRRGLPVA